ncbi:hypothetical protein ElyMa_004673700 [Elysia marginata]|uniref:Uncharacterized protein n=1 Tax=Elysia marginata TaxID=1093978 RepID=A0AAV4I491_9GAST|nr:hypothetical protein ElyMa_004673700 [Elysia marginata]
MLTRTGMKTRHREPEERARESPVTVSCSLCHTLDNTYTSTQLQMGHQPSFTSKGCSCSKSNSNRSCDQHTYIQTDREADTVRGSIENIPGTMFTPLHARSVSRGMGYAHGLLY